METVTLADLATLAIVGAVISTAVQFVKANTFFTPAVIRMLVVAFSLAAATGYFFFKDSGFLPVFLQITLWANTVYLFVIRPFEE